MPPEEKTITIRLPLSIATGLEEIMPYGVKSKLCAPFMQLLIDSMNSHFRKELIGSVQSNGITTTELISLLSTLKENTSGQPIHHKQVNHAAISE